MANTEVLMSLGGSQYIVKVDSTIPAGEIHIGRFAALDALVEATGAQVQTAAAAPAASAPAPAPAAPTNGLKIFEPTAPPVVYTPKHYKMTRLRGKEVAATRAWLEKRAGTLSKLEQTVMQHSFPAKKEGYINSNIVAAQTGLDADQVRNVRNGVMRKVGAMHRNA